MPRIYASGDVFGLDAFPKRSPGVKWIVGTTDGAKITTKARPVTWKRADEITNDSLTRLTLTVA